MGNVATELAASARRHLIGNTAQRVLDEFKCDVLIVKPLGLQSPGAARKK
jgi:nucleotide-binding universal stress UspA family protein